MVTIRGALPEVVGDIGYQVAYGDVSGTALAINQALAASSDEGLRARNRILTEFPLERRENALREAILSLCQI